VTSAHFLTKDGAGMSGAVRRWMCWQQERWPGFGGAKVQWADMTAAGIAADRRTIRNWRQGMLPGWRHIPDLARAYGWSLVDMIFEPVIGCSRLEEMQAEIDAQREALAERERDLDRLRAATSPRPLLEWIEAGGARSGDPRLCH